MYSSLRIRNINGRLRDWIPFLRIFPESSIFKEAVKVAQFRNKRLEELLCDFREKIENGEAEQCVAEVMLREDTGKLTEEEMTSVGNSMISSGIGLSFCYQ